jgi:hypothetical protein
MLHKFDISNNVTRFKQPTALKYLIEGDKNKTLPNVKSNIKPLIIMHDTKKVFEKTKK